MKRWPSWLLLVVVVTGALAVGVLDHREQRTDQERARDLAADVRCPTCAGQSALESQSATARGIRNEIQRRVELGQTDDEIMAFLESRYEGIRLSPPGDGVGGLGWVLPIVAGAVAAFGLVVTFRRWRARPVGAVRDEDRRLVEQARHREATS